MSNTQKTVNGTAGEQVQQTEFALGLIPKKEFEIGRDIKCVLCGQISHFYTDELLAEIPQFCSDCSGGPPQQVEQGWCDGVLTCVLCGDIFIFYPENPDEMPPNICPDCAVYRTKSQSKPIIPGMYRITCFGHWQVDCKTITETIRTLDSYDPADLDDFLVNGEVARKWLSENRPTPNDPPNQIIIDLGTELYNQGVKRGEDQCIAFLRGYLGFDHPILEDLTSHLKENGGT